MRIRFDGAPAALLLAVSATGLLAGCTLFSSPHDLSAGAIVLPTVGNQARGTVSFVERPDGVQVTYNFIGLPPNSDHALQIHERGDCNAGDGTSAGELFAPGADRLRGGSRPAGDFGNIHADANGVATGFVVEADVSLDGVRSVVNRAVLVHRDSSDPAFPQHDASPALACGTIRQ